MPQKTKPTYVIDLGYIKDTDILNCDFVNDSGTTGLAAFIDGGHMIDECMIDGCTFFRDDGGSVNGGTAGIWFRNFGESALWGSPANSYIKNVTVQNCYFEGNAKDEFIAFRARGGGVFTDPSYGENFRLLNCTFKFNAGGYEPQPNAISIGPFDGSGATVTNVVLDNIVIISERSESAAIKLSGETTETMENISLSNAYIDIEYDGVDANSRVLNGFNFVSNTRIMVTGVTNVITTRSIGGFARIGHLSDSTFKLADSAASYFYNAGGILYSAYDCGEVSSCELQGGITLGGSFDNCTIYSDYPVNTTFISGADSITNCDIYVPNSPEYRVIYLQDGTSQDFKYIGNNLYDSTNPVHSGSTSAVFFTTGADVRPTFRDNVFWTDRTLARLAGDASGTAANFDNNTVWDYSGTTYEYNTDYCTLSTTPAAFYAGTARMYPVGKRVYVGSGVTSGEQQGWVKIQEPGNSVDDWLDLPNLP